MANPFETNGNFSVEEDIRPFSSYTIDDFDRDRKVEGEIEKYIWHWMHLALSPTLDNHRAQSMSAMGLLNNWHNHKGARMESIHHLKNVLNWM